jgi:hypothetical protein
MATVDPLANQKEACKTYVEQTKLLVTLASAFLVAPAAALPLIRGSNANIITATEWRLFVGSESAFVFSVLLGYVVLATITGSQHDGTYNVYRPATRVSSIFQIVAYLVGLILFALLSLQLLTTPPPPPPLRPRVSLQPVGDVRPFPSGTDCYGVSEPALTALEQKSGGRDAGSGTRSPSQPPSARARRGPRRPHRL